MKSSFTVWLIPPLLMLILTISALVLVSQQLDIATTGDLIAIGVFYLVFLFLVAWLLFGEIRVRIISVELMHDHLVVKPYLGIGKKKIIYYSDLDGFKTTMLPNRYRTYEYLFLLRDGRRVVRLSAFYHRNFEELKEMIVSKKIKFLGSERFEVIRELKDLFG